MILLTSLVDLALQVVHAGANLFHTLLSLVPTGEASPPICFGRPAACVLMASNWLLNPRDKDQAQHGRPAGNLEFLTKWAWEACSHTIALGLDSVFLDQVCQTLATADTHQKIASKEVNVLQVFCKPDASECC